MSWSMRWVFLLGWCFYGWIGADQDGAGPPRSFKILTAEAGIYAVDFDALVKAGLAEKDLASHGLAMTQEGKAVPIWVADGGDGRLGPGDRIEFRGEVLAGPSSYYHEYSNFNVYVLTIDAEMPARMKPAPAAARWLADGVDDSAERTRYRADLHMEIDTVLGRFRHQREEQESWYWHKMACTDKQPFIQTISLEDLRADEGESLTLSVDFRGWSTQGRRKKEGALKDHVVHLYLNGSLLLTEEWDGNESYRITRKGIPISRFKVGENLISLRVPYREKKEGGKSMVLVDVVLLNWIELDYPKSSIADPERQSHFLLPDLEETRGPLHLKSANHGLVIYGEHGSRSPCAPKSGGPNLAPGLLAFELLPGESSFYTVAARLLKKPDAVIPMVESDLKSPARGADYIMVVHPHLADAIRPLAEFHRSRGLRVRVVDVFDIYNSFNHGIFHPRALKDFFEFAYHNWPGPAPHFILLVGDASWDTKNSKVVDQNYPDWSFYARHQTAFIKNGSTFYENSDLNNRNLVPTWNYYMYEGHSASDNQFACVEGDDFYPDMAIGRFPVTKPEEVSIIVKKTMAYASDPQVGPWRRNILWITNEEKRFQVWTDNLAGELSQKGFTAQKVYPESKEKSNQQHTRRILDALNEGQNLVYFYGHGGRYIWRTGPPDYRKNHDLFTLADLDKLQSTKRLSVILSFTCYSAPFDHPGADSIGEKFLRLPEKGAVAFLGASWRNSPNIKMNRAFMDAFSEPIPVGDAMVAAKSGLRQRVIVETYNLMGDPAIPLRPLPRNIELKHRLMAEKNEILVSGELESGIDGQGILDWIAKDGSLIHSQGFQAHGKQIRVSLKVLDWQLAEAHGLQCYIWDDQTKREASGFLALTKAEKSENVAPKQGSSGAHD